MRAAAGRIRNKFGPALGPAALVAKNSSRTFAISGSSPGCVLEGVANTRMLHIPGLSALQQAACGGGSRGYGLIIVIGCQASLHRQLNPIENVPVASAAGSFHHHAHFLYAGLLSSLKYLVVAPQYLACAAQVSLLPSAFKSR